MACVCPVALDMSSPVLSGGLVLPDNFEMNTTGIIFDSTLGKRSFSPHTAYQFSTEISKICTLHIQRRLFITGEVFFSSIPALKLTSVLPSFQALTVYL